MTSFYVFAFKIYFEEKRRYIFMQISKANKTMGLIA